MKAEKHLGSLSLTHPTLVTPQSLTLELSHSLSCFRSSCSCARCSQAHCLNTTSWNERTKSNRSGWPVHTLGVPSLPFSSTGWSVFPPEIKIVRHQTAQCCMLEKTSRDCVVGMRWLGCDEPHVFRLTKLQRCLTPDFQAQAAPSESRYHERVGLAWPRCVRGWVCG